MMTLLLLTLTLAATLLTGCAAPWPFPQPTPDPKLPDSQQIFRPLEFGSANGDLETLDPALIEFTSDQNLAQLVFPPLVTLDELGRPLDWAAESHEISSDGLTYTFHLRTSMTWSDGTPIDAQTFAYSINRALDPCTQSPVANYLYPIKGARAFNTGACPPGAVKSATTLIGSALLTSDPLTLNIILSQPAGYFLTALTNPIAWGVPQALVERYTTPSTDPQNPAVKVTWTEHLADNGGFGGNLYKLVSWKHRDGNDSAQLVLERNERFWGAKPLLRRIEHTLYSFSQAPDTSWIFFKQGTGDIAEPATSWSDYNSQDYARKYAQEVATARTLKGVQVTQSPLALIHFLRPNWQVAPFDDVRIRQAFSLALDRQALAQEALPELGQPSIHLVPEGVPGYNAGLADAAGHTGKDALSADVAMARRLATAYAAEKCGGSFAACPPVVIIPEPHSAVNYAIAETIQDQWRAAFPGWSVSISTIAQGQINWQSRAQLQLTGWLEDYPDPQDFLSQLFTPSSAYDQPQVNLAAVNTLCAQADASSDQTARLTFYQQAEQLLITQGAAIPLYQTIQTTAIRSRVVGWRLAPTGMTLLSVWQQVYVQR
jgi:ABC-type transport system substrate-binding protein